MRKHLRSVGKLALATFGYSIRRNPPWATKAGEYSIWPKAWGDYNKDDYEQLFGAEVVVGRQFYNIGAGSFRHPAWTNIDKSSDWYKGNNDLIAIDVDLLDAEPIAVEDGTAQVIFSSHVIEHLPNESVAHMFAEAYRMLKPGGVLRITCPDARVNYDAYARGDRIFFHYLYGTIQECFLHTFAAHLLRSDYPESMTPDEVDRVFATRSLEEAFDTITKKCSVDYQRTHPGAHMNWWHHEKLGWFLSQAGFRSILRSGFGQSICPVLRDTKFFDNTVPKFSLYLDAIK